MAPIVVTIPTAERYLMVLYFSLFILLVLGLLALDLGVFHREDEVMSTKIALGWTCFWIALSLLFNALIYVIYEHHWLGIGAGPEIHATGATAAIDFFTAYLVEKSLSLDNIFVIALVFSYFRVPAHYQHRVLFWGILGALAMRGLMIGAGIAAISQFSWLTYVLGGLLIATALKMMVAQQDHLEPDKNLIIRIVGRVFLVTKDYRGRQFFIKENGKWAATPLFLTLIMIESTDLLFAVDSIPAVLAITIDPFIVFTSNVFAILGMRSLYFALASLLDRFRFLKTSLIFILAFVGIKMILAQHVIKIDSLASLGVIGGLLLMGIAASIIANKSTPSSDISPLKELTKLSLVTVRTVRRLFFLAAGSTIILMGAIMILLPGPGLLVIFLGLTLLAVEFVWARVWIKKVEQRILDLQKSAHHLLKRGKRKP
jgi:tellurite resistance protein TerC